VRSTRGSRDAIAKTPYFLETISCPALILGDSCSSKQDLGFDESGKLNDISERISGESGEAFPIRDQG
jgi:hypothetical protein